MHTSVVKLETAIVAHFNKTHATKYDLDGKHHSYLAGYLLGIVSELANRDPAIAKELEQHANYFFNKIAAGE
jgi:hypothetical protein